MPYEKLPIGGTHREILSWANHEFSIEEQSMLRNVSRLPCLFKHGRADARCASGQRQHGRVGDRHQSSGNTRNGRRRYRLRP